MYFFLILHWFECFLILHWIVSVRGLTTWLSFELILITSDLLAKWSCYRVMLLLSDTVTEWSCYQVIQLSMDFVINRPCSHFSFPMTVILRRRGDDSSQWLIKWPTDKEVLHMLRTTQGTIRLNIFILGHPYLQPLQANLINQTTILCGVKFWFVEKGY